MEVNSPTVTPEPTLTTEDTIASLKKEIKELKKEMKNLKEVNENNKTFIEEQEKDVQTFYTRAVQSESALKNFTVEVGTILGHLQEALEISRKALQFTLSSFNNSQKEGK